MRTSFALILGLALITGCKKEPEDTEDTSIPTPIPTPIPTETGMEGCGDSSPSLDEITVANGSDAAGVALAFTLGVSDADGGIHEVSFEVWSDDTPDGTVNTAGPPAASGGPAVVDGVDPCSVDGGLALTVALPVDGTGIPFNTELDFAWRVIDADGNPSNILTVTGFSPREDGTDGGSPIDTGDTDLPVDTDDTDLPVDTADTDLPVDTSDTDVPNPTCADPASIVAGANAISGLNQELIIYAVDWADDIVWLKNLRANPVDIDSGWDLCTDAFQYQVLPATTIPAGGDLWIHLRATGTDDAENIYLGLGAAWDLDDDRTMILYRNFAYNSGSHLAGGIESYMKWGPGAPFRPTEGSDAGLWDGNTVAVNSGDMAIVADGSDTVTLAAGFSSLPSYLECLP